MYTSHFGFQFPPFENSPDPANYYMGKQYRESLAALIHGVTSHKGLMCITGAVGSGKTTLGRVLVQHLPTDTRFITLSYPRISTTELFSSLAGGLGIYQAAEDRLALLNAIQDELVRLDRNDRRCVLVIDEAQLVPEALWNEILAFSNLETVRHKLVQIVLLGQRELRAALSRPPLRQLRQRIAVARSLEPMGLTDTCQYIAHRLEAAGGGATLFSEAAAHLVYEYSRGVPRLINMICDVALLKAFLGESPHVNRDSVLSAVDELELDEQAVEPNLRQPKEGNVVAKSKPEPPKMAPVPGPHPEQFAARPMPSIPVQKRRTKSSGLDRRTRNPMGIGIVVAALITLGVGVWLGLPQPQKATVSKTRVLRQRIPSAVKKPAPVPSMRQTVASTQPPPDPAIPKGPAVPAPERVGEDADTTSQADTGESLPGGEAAAPFKMAPGYSLFLASFKNLDNAKRAASQYREKGLTAHWVKVQLEEKGIWYRVFTGQFPTIAQALQFKDANGLDGSLVRRIGYGTLIARNLSAADMEQKRQMLITHGLSPLVVTDAGGQRGLFAGMFARRAQARRQCDELVSQGIFCRVVAPES